MAIENAQESLADGDLDIEVEAVNGKTMSVRHVKHGGKLRFNNKDRAKKLLIMSPAENPPFVTKESSDPVSWFEVPPGKPKVVTISPYYEPESRFPYTALIDGSAAEDPIVIIDRR
jgi:hypothetical protein